MYKSVIFIDFENLQKIDEKIIDPKTKIIIVVGLNQDNKAYEFAKNLFPNISSIELIKVNGKGLNALDFFITFYLGKYFESIKESEIIICSKDKGYDPLIKHLDEYGISIKKHGFNKNIEKKSIKKEKENNEAQKSITKNAVSEMEKIIDFLQKQTKVQKSKRPKKSSTLITYLYTHFAQKITYDDIKIAIEYLENNKFITITNNRITYNKI